MHVVKPGKFETTHYTICIEGVTYLMYGRRFSVMLNADSKIIPCQ